MSVISASNSNFSDVVIARGVWQTCKDCGFDRRMYVNKCRVCELEVKLNSCKNVNETLSREVASSKAMYETLLKEFESFKKSVIEMREEISVRKDNSLTDREPTRQVDVVKGNVSPRLIANKERSESPRQAAVRGQELGIVDSAANPWNVVTNRRNRPRVLEDRKELNCSNRFDCLSDREGEAGYSNGDVSETRTETLLIGDSQIKYLYKKFGKLSKRKRMQVCYPGARVNDIVERIEREVAYTDEDATVIVHVGTNDVRDNRSEELLADYKRLIQRLKNSGRNCVISGILPRMGVGIEWSSRAIGINNRISFMCNREGIGFLDLWEEFQDRSLFAKDGVHLSYGGVELLGDAFEAYLSGN